jgi:hypothetical protein
VAPGTQPALSVVEGPGAKRARNAGLTKKWMKRVPHFWPLLPEVGILTSRLRKEMGTPARPDQGQNVPVGTQRHHGMGYTIVS